MFSRLAVVFVLVLGLVGCQTTDGEGTKQRVGTILGGVAGAVAGSQIGKGSGRVAAGAAGALLGAFLGNQIGLSLDRADRLAMQKTTTTALRLVNPVPRSRGETQIQGTEEPSHPNLLLKTTMVDIVASFSKRLQ